MHLHFSLVSRHPNEQFFLQKIISLFCLRCNLLHINLVQSINHQSSSLVTALATARRRPILMHRMLLVIVYRARFRANLAPLSLIDPRNSRQRIYTIFLKQSVQTNQRLLSHVEDQTHSTRAPSVLSLASRPSLSLALREPSVVALPTTIFEGKQPLPLHEPCQRKFFQFLKI